MKNDDFALRLRECRARTGFTQDEVATRIARLAYNLDGSEAKLTGAMVSTWECGSKRPRKKYRRLFCTLYKTTEAALGFTPSADDGAIEAVAAAEPPAQYLEQMNYLMSRKTAILAASSVVFATAFPKLTDAVGDRVGPPDIEEVEHAVEAFRTWDHKFGGDRKRKAVLAQLGEVTDLLTFSHSAEMTRRLFYAAAQLAKLAATMAWDSGSHNTAQHYYRVALYNAQAADDGLLGASILGAIARQLLYLGHAPEALDLVQKAQKGTSEDRSPAIASMLYSREAWAHANLGDVPAFRRATEQASAALADGANTCDPWGLSYDEAELLGTTGGRLLDLARCKGDKTYAAEATTVIRQSITMRQGGSIRSRALDQLGLAESVFRQREPEEGVRLGHAAADIAERTQSDRVRLKLHRLLRSTDVYSAVTMVRELRERISTIQAA